MNNGHSAHWYTPQGELVETYTNKKGGQSKVTLTQARKMGLVPSVTTIIKDQVANFGIQRYREKQILEAAATTPRTSIQTDEEWQKDVRVAADQHAEEAAEAGTMLHDQIRDWISIPSHEKGPTLGFDSVLFPVFDWIEAHCNLGLAESEKVWVDSLGRYAGTIDLLAPARDGNGWLLVDFKSQERDRLEPWDDYPLQLAGYADCVAIHQDWNGTPCTAGGPLRRITLLLHRTRPQIRVHEWDQGDMERHTRIWRRVLENWRDSKKYWPGGDRDQSPNS